MVTQNNENQKTSFSSIEHEGKFIRGINLVSSLVLILIALSTSFFLTACGINLPSENDAKQVFLNLYSDGKGSSFIAQGKAKIADFKKTNALKLTQNGIEFYVIESIITIECLGEFTKKLSPFVETIFCAPGKQAVITPKIGFEKTEQGWRGIGIIGL